MTTLLQRATTTIISDRSDHNASDIAQRYTKQTYLCGHRWQQKQLITRRTVCYTRCINKFGIIISDGVRILLSGLSKTCNVRKSSILWLLLESMRYISWLLSLFLHSFKLEEMAYRFHVFRTCWSMKYSHILLCWMPNTAASTTLALARPRALATMIQRWAKHASPSSDAYLRMLWLHAVDLKPSAKRVRASRLACVFLGFVVSIHRHTRDTHLQHCTRTKQHTHVREP